MQAINQFYVIGISISTTNQNGNAVADIQQLWNRFFAENIPAKIPNKLSNTIYCIYTNYTSDYTQPYTAILGCKVESLATIPEGLTGKALGGANYVKFNVKGKISDGVIFKEWTKIWNSKFGIQKYIILGRIHRRDKNQVHGNAQIRVNKKHNYEQFKKN